MRSPHTDREALARALHYYLEHAHWGKGDPERDQIQALFDQYRRPPTFDDYEFTRVEENPR